MLKLKIVKQEISAANSANRLFKIGVSHFITAGFVRSNVGEHPQICSVQDIFSTFGEFTDGGLTTEESCNAYNSSGGLIADTIGTLDIPRVLFDYSLLPFRDIVARKSPQRAAILSHLLDYNATYWIQVLYDDTIDDIV